MPRRIRFIFGQTEESDPWDDMAAYVAHEEPVRFGFTPDADFPAIYCEKGILRLHLTMPLTDSGILDAKGGTVVNMGRMPARSPRQHALARRERH